MFKPIRRTLRGATWARSSSRLLRSLSRAAFIPNSTTLAAGGRRERKSIEKSKRCRKPTPTDITSRHELCSNHKPVRGSLSAGILLGVTLRAVSGVEDHQHHAARNARLWDKVNAPRYAEPGRESWKANEISWGNFGILEADLRALPEDFDGLDIIELGCGTAYFSSWLARRGGRVTGVDISMEQLKTAQLLQSEHDLHFPLIAANAESVPAADASFDLVISEYGASTWADPYQWVPEASRVLRPGGELVFLVNGTLWLLTVPDTDDAGPAADRLLRPYFGINRVEWPGTTGVEFHLGYGDWIRLLRANGLEVVDLVELRAPEGTDSASIGLVDPAWARAYPAEHIWRARKPGGSTRHSR
jgi:SAM-dependent methyltransferase